MEIHLKSECLRHWWDMRKGRVCISLWKRPRSRCAADIALAYFCRVKNKDRSWACRISADYAMQLCGIWRHRWHRSLHLVPTPKPCTSSGDDMTIRYISPISPRARPHSFQFIWFQLWVLLANHTAYREDKITRWRKHKTPTVISRFFRCSLSSLVITGCIVNFSNKYVVFRENGLVFGLSSNFPGMLQVKVSHQVEW